MKPQYMSRVMLFVAMFVMSFLTVTFAFSHDANVKWIMDEPNYRDMNNQAVHCCGPEDCHMWPEDNVELTQEGYKLSTGELIPYEKAYTTPADKAAQSLYWRCHKWNYPTDGAESRTPGDTRCFWAPGAGF